MTGRLSSSSSFNYQWTYDVFLNFRGEDTRHGFVGNLFDALRRKGIHTFMDDGELRKGDEITPSLFKAIEQSRMAITVFSKNYASSTFCLAELDKILQHIKRNGRLVWPIFYGVKPSDVRYLKGNYEKALSMHQNNFKANEETVQSWKLALREAACLSGSHFNPGHEYEYQFIQKIVSEISSKINITPLYIAKNPIGLESRVPKIVSLLQIDSHDEVIMLGIYGIGGIGKSTIARAVFNSIADQFEGLCFLDDIKQGSSKHGIKKKQERMLKNTLEVNIKVEDVNQGISIIKRRLNQKKILLVLDNVDKQEQLENIAGNCDWFGPGSRIIITTRDKHLLAIHGVEKLYEVKELNNEESLELLSWNAFKNNQVDPSYVEVLNCVVKYTKGLPLALKVIGSHLSGKSIEEWKSAIDIYKRNPNKEVHGILKVSYDGLEEVVQEIFLDIACFFKGKDMKYVKDMIQNVRGFDPTYCIGVLMDKCLINYGYDYVVMHDLIQDMGREIIHQESPNEPGKRSRLWNNEDIAHVLENNTGTNTIVMIQDNLSQDIKVNWNGKALKKMKNLKMLMFTNTYFSEGPKYLPNSLRVLKWLKYPSSSLPGHFHPTKLAILDLNQGELQSLEPFKELHEAGDTEFCVPGARIPELFESCRGPSIYFKFCNKYPAISLCLFIPRNKSVCRKFLWAQVIVNDQEIFKGNIWDTELSLLADHIFIYDLRRAYNNMDHVLLENSWNSMEVRIYKEGYSFPYDIGINVIKAESRKEDIQFNDPYKRRKIESLKWDSVFMASSCGYASDEDLQQPQDLNRRNLTLDPMEWEYPAEMLEDRLDLNDQAGTTCDKGLQQQQHLIPKSSGNENVRKVKGKDKMVCRRKKRRIH